MGGAYEVTTDANNVALSTKKYYSIAGMTVAMNDGSGLQYLLTDHLGSVVGITDASGTLTSPQRYLPFGGTRTDLNGPRITNTDFGYTGQRNNSYMGLMDYHARFYDAALMRWTQPDTITPGGPQGMNRFSYVNENPINATDPTGHDSWWCDSASCETKYMRDKTGVIGGHAGPPLVFNRPVYKSPQSNKPDLVSEFSKLTGITSHSACGALLDSSNPLCNLDYLSKKTKQENPSNIVSKTSHTNILSNNSPASSNAEDETGFGFVLKQYGPGGGLVPSLVTTSTDPSVSNVLNELQQFYFGINAQMGYRWGNIYDGTFLIPAAIQAGQATLESVGNFILGPLMEYIQAGL